jgi:hypothetical protein
MVFLLQNSISVFVLLYRECVKILYCKRAQETPLVSILLFMVSWADHAIKVLDICEVKEDL